MCNVTRACWTNKAAWIFNNTCKSYNCDQAKLTEQSVAVYSKTRYNDYHLIDLKTVVRSFVLRVLRTIEIGRSEEPLVYQCKLTIRLQLNSKKTKCL